jgi:hypothetical protein
MTTTTGVGSTSGSGKSTVDENTVLDLKTSDEDILKMIKKTYGTAGSAEDRALLQRLLEMRSNNASLLSNMYRSLAETTRSIIQNIRS